MKLYNKKLRNLDELQKEKRRLRREKKELDSQELISVDSILASVGGVKGIGSGILQQIMPLISSFSGPALELITKLFRKKKADTAPGTFQPYPTEPHTNSGKTQSKHRNVVRSVATEVLGSYIKWKAMELTYKGLSLIVKKRKKAERAAENRP